MPVIRSAKKKLRVDKKRQSANKKIKALLEISIKKAKRTPTPKRIQASFSLADKAVKKGVMHKNKGSRIKSRLSKLLKPKLQKPESAKRTTKKLAKKTSA